MTLPDDAARAKATRAFAEACFAKPVPESELTPLLAKAGTLPAFEHAAIQHMHLSNTDETLHALRAPTLVIFGTKERLVGEAMARYTVAAVPNAKLSLYSDSGHAPFIDETERFDEELGKFAANVASTKAQ